MGDKLEVGIGTHGQLTTYSAIRVAHAMEQYSPFWFEEPVPPENVDEMARVAAHTSIPIATGERLVSKYEFSEVLEKQAAQIHAQREMGLKQREVGLKEQEKHPGNINRLGSILTKYTD